MQYVSPQQRQLYLAQQDAIETFYAFHPEAFEKLTEEEMELLEKYYFIRQEIDVENIVDYAADLLQGDPTIWKRAEAVLQKVCVQLRLDERMMDELLPERQVNS